MSLIVAIDPSLTSTGIVVLQDSKLKLAETTKNMPKLSTIERVRLIREQITNIIENIPDKENSKWQAPDLIVIEGFSYGSKGRGVFDIAYLGWRIREALESFRERDKIPWIEVSPSQLKQFATGKGNAPKDVILQQVYKHWGFETSDHNIADAFVLAKIGEAHLKADIVSPDRLFQEYHLYQLQVVQALKGEKPAKKSKRR